MKEIFISHSNTDAVVVKNFVTLLEKLGVNKEKIFCTSLEETGITNGSNIPDTIFEHLPDAKIIFYFLSQEFFKSEFCASELGAGLVLEKMDKTKLFFYNLGDTNASDLRGFVNANRKYSHLNPEGLAVMKDVLDSLDITTPRKNITMISGGNDFLSAATPHLEYLKNKRNMRSKTHIKIVEPNNWIMNEENGYSVTILQEEHNIQNISNVIVYGRNDKNNGWENYCDGFTIFDNNSVEFTTRAKTLLKYIIVGLDD